MKKSLKKYWQEYSKKVDGCVLIGYAIYVAITLLLLVFQTHIAEYLMTMFITITSFVLSIHGIYSTKAYQENKRKYSTTPVPEVTLPEIVNTELDNEPTSEENGVG